MPMQKVLLCCLGYCVAAVIQPASHAAEKYESPPTLKAAKVLPDNLLRSEHHRVRAKVSNDGFMNTYFIESDFGEFEAQGMGLLNTRVREIGVLAQLNDLSRTEVFAKAALEAGLSPVNAIVDFSKHPIKTITGIPGGIGRMLGRYSRAAKRGVEQTSEFVAGDDEDADQAGESEPDDEAQSDEEKEKEPGTGTKLTEGYFGVSGAERRWHQQFGTDPYTSNEALNAAIKSVAWADRLGSFGLKFVSLPQVPGADIVGEASDLVWSKDPYELEEYNRGVLSATGADETLSDAFFEQRWFTPSLQTTLIAAISALEGVENRDLIVRRAIEVESEAEARIVLDSTLLLVSYHQSRAPLTRIVAGTPLPSALDGNGIAVVAVALDHLVWTEQMALAAQRYAEVLRAAGAKSIECWLSGTTSKKARRRLEDRTCAVHTEADQLLVTQPEPAVAP